MLIDTLKDTSVKLIDKYGSDVILGITQKTEYNPETGKDYIETLMPVKAIQDTKRYVLNNAIKSETKFTLYLPENYKLSVNDYLYKDGVKFNIIDINPIEIQNDICIYEIIVQKY